MAKKKVLENSNDIEDALISKFGSVFQKADEIKDNPPKIIPTTPQLDIMLSGGIPEGSFVLVSGQPKLGKSSLALQIASNAQKVDSEFGPRKVYYFDIEGRIKERDLFSNKNLDTSPDRFMLIKSSLDKLIYGEEFMSIGEELIRNQRGGIFIFDSFSALCTKDRLEKDLGERQRDGSALLLSGFCKRIAQVIPVNKSTVIGITHLIANQDPGPRKWTEASGRKIQYQADVKLRCTHKTDWKVTDDIIGQDVHWECETSALGQPGMKAIGKLRYNYGYDEMAELVDLACMLNVLKKSGSWIKWKDRKGPGEDLSFQGSEKWIVYLRHAEKDAADLKEAVHNIIHPKTDE